MARFRGAKYLSCFYCGKRSSLRYDGVTRDFLCLYCDATNYLDENGDITDPPVATEREATTTRFAAPKVPAPTDSIFCPTCLKNQHLFTKSLAQYFPDDPSDPDYAQLERNYYRYRRGLEQRYPQVCDDCADKVEARIRQAGYTAKTDHLRRMMDLSRGRKPLTTRTSLDRINTLGRMIWNAGFLLQLLWHLTAVVPLLDQPGDGLRDPDVPGFVAATLGWINRLTAASPAPDTLMWWSTAAAVASAWWNPHFVQFNRGFTRHLLGFTQWYCFQALIIFCRAMFRGVLVIDGGLGQSSQAQVSAHIAMAAIMALMFFISGKSIRVDISPLFASSSAPIVKEAASPNTRKQEATKTFSELFNDALDSTKESPQKQGQESPFQPPPSSFTPRTSRQMSKPAPSFGNLFLSNDSPAQSHRDDQYAEEMDWSPIPTRHRAFAEQPSPIKGASAFGHAPTDGKNSSPFWYKVPAAPVNPAQRLRNPPRAPEPQQPPVEASRVMFTNRRRDKARDTDSGEKKAAVEFRQPKFFAPEQDDASSLADLLSQSFSLSQETDQDTEEDDGERAQVPPVSRKSPKAANKSSKMPLNRDVSLAVGLVENMLVSILLLSWLLVLSVPIPRRSECQLAVMAVAAALALRDMADTSIEQRGDSLATHLLSAWAVAELAAICWTAVALWRGDSTNVGLCGSGVLATMLLRQTLRRIL
ncbi:hypothetical protein HIM_07903 [Hirsutella minnesotensis 3608]|uniref:Ima1 N-terminal domain-containing protein n=1 Tax=Hirsutella minnesotensis 3608 TaxID=1043627 RepID=A0A0F7ZHI7_9HYPO|nr:hypothetical protein HIM_07903 [Hirsutella minnesotensis 3608]